MNILLKLNKYDDHYFTPKAVWEQISQYLPRGEDTLVWEPFYHGDSNSAKVLSDMGCNVVHDGDLDFFEHLPVSATHIVTNPPFSIKERVFKRLAEIGLPFIVIIPTHSLSTRFIKNSFKDKIQIFIPAHRLHFEKKDDATGDIKTLKRTPFDSIFVCYKMGLERDIMWLD